MSIARRQKLALGVGLLNVVAWIRRQPWIKTVYGYFPSALRTRVSQALAAYLSERVRFKRTPNWRDRPRPPELESADSTARAEYDGAVGVNIFACVRGQFGLAEGARLYARALMAEGYPVAIHNIDIDIPHGMGDVSFDSHIGEDLPNGVNLIFVNPDHLDEAINSIGLRRMNNRYTIACWFWELEVFPKEWMPALQLVDEVMVSTGFIQNAVGLVTKKPVWRAPLPVSEVHDSGLIRADFGLHDDSFVFLNTFDFNSFLARKNPQAVIEAFRLAFADGRADVRLLIKSSNGHRHQDKLRELLGAAAGDPRIMVRDEVIDRGDVQALQRCVDAYVSLHRAEGFGLGLAECMRLGKPVIATAWSGNMDFMTADNSCLVEYRLVPVGEGEYVHHAGQRWAEPSVEHAASQMRRLLDDREFAARIGAQAARDIRNLLSPHVSAQGIIERVEALSSSGVLATPSLRTVLPSGTI